MLIFLRKNLALNLWQKKDETTWLRERDSDLDELLKKPIPLEAERNYSSNLLNVTGEDIPSEDVIHILVKHKLNKNAYTLQEDQGVEAVVFGKEGGTNLKYRKRERSEEDRLMWNVSLNESERTILLFQKMKRNKM